MLLSCLVLRCGAAAAGAVVLRPYGAGPFLCCPCWPVTIQEYKEGVIFLNVPFVCSVGTCRMASQPMASRAGGATVRPGEGRSVTTNKSSCC